MANNYFNMPDELKNLAKLEAILFIYGEPLSYKKVSEALNVTEEEIARLVDRLANELSLENRGLGLVKDSEKVQLATKPEFNSFLEGIVKETMNENLTSAALETLALVSYIGPVSRSEIEYIRGVNTAFTLRNLLIKGLIQRSLDPKRGNVYLYKPSLDLLKFLGLSKIAELPDYEKFKELTQRFRQVNEQN